MCALEMKRILKTLAALVVTTAVTGCGVDAMSTAANAGAAKSKEGVHAKKTVADVRGKLTKAAGTAAKRVN